MKFNSDSFIKYMSKTKKIPKRIAFYKRFPTVIERQWTRYLTTGRKYYRPHLYCVVVGGIEKEIMYIKGLI